MAHVFSTRTVNDHRIHLRSTVTAFLQNECYTTHDKFVKDVSRAGIDAKVFFEAARDRTGRWNITSAEIFRAVIEDFEGDVSPSSAVVKAMKTIGSVLSICEDREGSIWVGDGNNGVTQFRPRTFEKHSSHDLGFVSNEVFDSLICNARDVVWGITSKDRLVQFHEGEFLRRSWNGVGKIGKIACSHDGTLWVLHSGDYRLSRIDGTQVEHYPHDLGRIAAIFESRDGTLWINAKKGLASLNAGEFHAHVVPNEVLLPIDFRGAIAETSDGTIWFSGKGLLVGLLDGTFRQFSSADGLPESDIRSIHEGSDGNLWLATYGNGLVRVSGEEVICYSTDQGMYDNFLGKIFEDDNGNLWINTNRGVTSVALTQLKDFAEGKTSHVLFRTLRSGERNGGFGVATSDGRFWFPTMQGYVIVDPTKENFNLVAPLIAFEHATAGGKSIDVRNSVKISPGDRNLEIHYAGTSFVHAEDVNFRYRLHGYDTDWTDVGLRHAAYYTNLPPGTYRFEVMAQNSDGLWGESKQTAELVMLPYFFETKVFHGSVVVCLASLVFAGYRFRTSSIRARNTALQNEITERMQVEEALRESEERFDLAVEGAEAGVWDWDVTTGIQYWSPQIFEQLAYEPNEFVPDYDCLLSLIHDEDRARFLAAIRAHHEQGKRFCFECRLQAKTGKYRWFRISGRATFSSPGVPTRMVGTFENITRRKEAEEETLVYQEELAHVARLNAMGELATGIAHELNQPLAAISTYCYVASELTNSDKDSASEIRRILQQIEDQSLRAGKIIKRMRSYVRKRSPVRTVVDLVSLVREVVQFLDREIYQNNIAIKLDLADEALEVEVDEIQIQQVLLKLVQNAMDAMKALPDSERQIVIAAHCCRTDQFEVVVSDSGSGFTDGESEQVFDAFFSTKESGLGLGLAISRSIIEKHGGRLWAEPNVDRGVTFRFTIQRWQDEDASGEPLSSRRLIPEASVAVTFKLESKSDRLLLQSAIADCFQI